MPKMPRITYKIILLFQIFFFTKTDSINRSLELKIFQGKNKLLKKYIFMDTL